MSSNIFLKAAKFLLYSSVLALLIVSTAALFPLAAPKVIFYRTVIELALIAFALFYLVLIYKKDWRAAHEFNGRLKAFLRNPIFIAVLVFFISALISVIFAPNSYRAFFGNLERGEGFWGLFHYGLFLFLGLLVFEKKDWLRFAKFLLVAVFVMMAWSWLQFSDFDSNSLANDFLSAIFSGDRLNRLASIIGSSFQPGSFLGNPNLLVGSIIATLAAVAFLYFSSPPRSFWRYASVVFGLAAAVTTFVLSVRGAVLGLGTGILFLLLYFAIWGRPTSQGRRTSLAVIGILVIVGGVFWFTRTADFWEEMPGFGRFRSASFENPSVATRLIATEVSWSAFLEKPVFGWGPENYNIAYNKHYDPRYALYAEDWFDRAHNKIAEVAVVQGVFGLAAYLGIFASVFYFLFKRREVGTAAPFLMAALIAYFVQNLFSFDSIASYIPFFAVLGFLIAETSNMGRFDLPNIDVNVRRSNLQKLASVIVIVIIIVASLYALYAWNFLPWQQAKRFISSVDKPASYLEPYTFAQGEIRNRFLMVLHNNNLVRDERFKPFVQEAIAALEEQVEKEPYEPRNFTLLAETYNELAKDDPLFFEKSVEYVRKAIELSPNRQSVLFELAVTLAGKGERDEALELSRRLVSENEALAKAHYQLALVLGLTGDSSEALRELDAARRLAWDEPLGYPAIYHGPPAEATQAYLFSESDLNNMVALYRTWGRPEEAADVLKLLIWKNFWFGRRNPRYYYDAIDIYRTLRDREGIITTAEQLKKVNPTLADDMDVLIDLAEKENWEILNTL